MERKLQAILSQQSMTNLKFVLGSLDFLNGKKCIKPSYVITKKPKDYDNWKVVYGIPGCYRPVSDLDWWWFSFLRAYCDGTITAGQTLRDDPALDFSNIIAKYPDLQQLYKQESLPCEYATELFKKKFLVMSRKLDLETIIKCKLFTSNYANITILDNSKLEHDLVTKYEATKSFLDQHHISIAPPEVNTFSKAVEYLQKEKNVRRVHIEAGPRLYQDYFYDDSLDNPMDLVVITVLVPKGEIPVENIGNPFPPIGIVLKKYNLVYTSKGVEDHSGTWNFLVFEKN